MSPSFSDRMGVTPAPPPITVTADAPKAFTSSPSFTVNLSRLKAGAIASQPGSPRRHRSGGSSARRIGGYRCRESSRPMRRCPCTQTFNQYYSGTSIVQKIPSGSKSKRVWPPAPLRALSIRRDPNPLTAGGITVGPPLSCQRIRARFGCSSFSSSQLTWT